MSHMVIYRSVEGSPRERQERQQQDADVAEQEVPDDAEAQCGERQPRGHDPSEDPTATNHDRNTPGPRRRRNLWVASLWRDDGHISAFCRGRSFRSRV